MRLTKCSGKAPDGSYIVFDTASAGTKRSTEQVIPEPRAALKAGHNHLRLKD